MEISFDARKRADTLAHRGLDFADALQVFAGRHLTLRDDRKDYGEPRFQSVGWLNDRMVMVVWTPRPQARHVMSMRKCNDREQRRYAPWLD
ncbi:MAG: BrnT family toxin [Alphaproteobacteria bacterium]|jgi:uncharacterized DUF497 family protein